MFDFLAQSASEKNLSLPIFPLNTVLFPGGLLPLKVFEQRYMDMSKKCLSENTPFGVCLLKAGGEVAAAEGVDPVPEHIGTLAQIVDWDMPQLGVLHLKAVGTKRFQLVSHHLAQNGLMIGEIRLLPPSQSKIRIALPEKQAVCAQVLKMIVAKLGEARFHPPFDFADAEWVGYRLAEALPLKLVAKQNMLEMNDAVMRLEILHKFLASQGLVA